MESTSRQKERPKYDFQRFYFFIQKIKFDFARQKKGERFRAVFFYFSKFLNHFKVLIEKKDLIP